MSDVLELAPTGRAKCRGCGLVMAKGELRFGESLANPFGEGEAYRWFHLVCAACMRPDKLLPVLDAHAGEVFERAWLRQTAVTGEAHRRLHRLARVERASSGRARCRSCKEPIAKGQLRFALQTWEEDVRPAPMGFIHVTCAEPYFGTRELLERAVRLTPELSEDDAAELAQRLARPGPSLAKVSPPDDEGSAAESA